MFTGIRLQNFRSYKDQTFELDRGVNIVVGPNASGKTNLLESIYVLSKGKSFRAKDQELIRHNTNWARIDAIMTDGERVVKIKNNPKVKTIEVSPQKIFNRLPTRFNLPVVLFVPEHLRLIHGSPTLRREYLDKIVTQLHPERTATYNRYQRALLQRNTLLKQASPDKDELFVWGVKLIEYGAKIAQWRFEIINEINKLAPDTYTKIGGKKNKIKFNYTTNLGAKINYQHNLASALNSNKDQSVGYTTSGPHRDDFYVSLNDHNSINTASRGEVRSIVLTAKIIEAKLLEKQFNKQPILLFDDVFSELDGARRDKLASILGPYQIIITTTDADSIAIKSFKNAQFIAI